MTVSDASSITPTVDASKRDSKFAHWIPVGISIAYPWVLESFHDSLRFEAPGAVALGTLWIAIAFLAPISCLAFAMGRGPFARFAPISPASRRIALAGVAVPPLFVLTGVVSSLLHSPVPERVTWAAGWCALGLAGSLARPTTMACPGHKRTGRRRVVHGVAAALILLFLVFHLSNHLLGLVGPDLHTRVMRVGRTVYRSTFVEPVLVGLLLFQVAGGLRLAWRWSRDKVTLARGIQVGSGVYLAAFILAHMNSAFISARAIHKIDTNWAWASGAPSGLIADAWNIRLLPHYALGVFFVIAHLFCGLRDVLLAHSVSTSMAGRIWFAGLMFAVALSAAITCGLCGLRI